MSNAIISVENLGKRYVIGHQKNKAQKGHDTLRDSLSEKFRNFSGNFKTHSKKSLKYQKKYAEFQSKEEFWALKGLSFEINQGDRIGIIGRNGAGKSTLLKVLSQITDPTEGTIQLEGRVASLLEVGTGFHPELTGRENVYLNGAILGMTRHEISRKFDEIVQFSEVERFIDTPVKRYSSGMHVRLAFAIAAHLEPEILIIDEVLAVGDAKFRDKCMGKMKSVASDGRTVIFVSHQMGMLAQLCTRAIMLERGQLVYQGTTQDTIQRYMESLGHGSEAAYIAPESAKHKEVYISELQLLNNQGEPASDFKHVEPIILKIKGRFNQFVKDVMLAVTVKDRLERKVFTERIMLENWNIDKHTSEFTAYMEIPGDFLMPQRFLFLVLLGIPKVKILDSVDYTCPFSIIDVGSKEAIFEGKDTGCVFAPCRWSVEA